MTTFVVKVTADPRGGLHGTVSRVAGGETRTFAGSAQLVALLEEWTASEGVWAATAESAALTGMAGTPAQWGVPAEPGSPARTND
jgi:hypothetical protein